MYIYMGINCNSMHVFGVFILGIGCTYVTPKSLHVHVVLLLDLVTSNYLRLFANHTRTSFSFVL